MHRNKNLVKTRYIDFKLAGWNLLPEQRSHFVCSFRQHRVFAQQLVCVEIFWLKWIRLRHIVHIYIEFPTHTTTHKQSKATTLTRLYKWVSSTEHFIENGPNWIAMYHLAKCFYSIAFIHPTHTNFNARSLSLGTVSFAHHLSIILASNAFDTR